jgi:hypothetical protein
MFEKSQRATRRFPTRVAVSINHANGEHHGGYGATRDLSVGGVYFYTPSRLQKAHELRLVLPLPPELVEGSPAWLICDAEVLRVEPQKNERFGVAARITHYEVLHDRAIHELDSVT